MRCPNDKGEFTTVRFLSNGTGSFVMKIVDGERLRNLGPPSARAFLQVKMCFVFIYCCISQIKKVCYEGSVINVQMICFPAGLVIYTL